MIRNLDSGNADRAPTPSDLTFLTPPGEVADWRMILLADALGAAGVFDALPSTAQALAADLGLDTHALRVELDALAALGVVERVADGAYGPTAATPDATSLASIRHHARALRRWASAAEACLRGEANEGGGPPADPEMFHDALANTARNGAPAIVDACLARFPDARTVLDLGGLHGEYSLEFTRRGLRATMQDLPAMIEVARGKGRLEGAGVELYEGSFFDSVPDGPFDLAFCSGITHTFDGERNLTLYRNLRPVVASGGGVAVVTFLRNRNPITSLFAVQMLVNANGGDTHTEAEYRQWLTEAGFTVDDAVQDLEAGPNAGAGRGARSILFAI